MMTNQSLTDIYSSLKDGNDIPSIQSIQPISGGVGDLITITGSHFSSDASENNVYFGNMQAAIVNTTANELQVIVPHATGYAPVNIYSNGLYATSSQRFNVTFNAQEELQTSHLSQQLENPYLGAKYYDVKIADMNGDGIAEIVTSEAGSGSSAYLALFTTSFDDEGMLSIDERLEINFGTGVYSSPQDIALGDINGDGLLDVALSEKGDVTDDFESHTVVLINTSDNQSFSFDAPIIISGEGYEGYVQLQDINGDGKLDIVTSRQTYNQTGVYLNTSDDQSVSFASKIIFDNVVAAPRPAFADLNSDGMIDMVATAYLNNGRDVFIYSNISTEGNIDFNLEFSILAGGEPPGETDWNWSSANPTLADIDGDGQLDIVVTNGNCGFGCSISGVSIIRNISTNSELEFEYENSDFYQYQSNSWPLRIGVADLNGDGKPDLLTNDWLGGISIMVNTSTEGNISLEEQIQLGVGSFPLSMAAADLNMDSTPEIIVSNWEVEGMRVLHNFIPINDNPLPGDVNNDGTIDILDIITTVNLILDNTHMPAADLNDDGNINILDIILMVDLILSPLDQQCYLEPDPGNCLGAFPSFYYDSTTDSCNETIWGDCEGMAPFQTLEDYIESCE